MTSLTPAEIEERFGPPKDKSGRDEVIKWLKERNLPLNRSNRIKARAKITNAKIKQEIGKEFSQASTAADWQIIYGECRVGGIYTFVHTTNNNLDLHLVLTVAAHEVDYITHTYFDDEEIVFAAQPGWSTKSIRPDGTENTGFLNKVYMDVNYGSTGQAALASLITNCPDKWNANRKQSGRAHIYLNLKWDPLLYPNGIPDISFTVKGAKCYDPRTATTVWTDNPALCLGNYLMNTEYGLSVPLADIDSTLWQAAANACEESVGLNGGGTEERYTCNGFFTAGNTHRDMIELLLSSMVGELILVGGSWKMYAGKYRAPTITLDENDFLGPIEVRTMISRRDNFNAVKGTYVDKNKKFTESEMPPYQSATYKAQDNNEVVWEDIQLPFTTSGATAQRIAKLLLEKQRQGIQVTGLCGLRAYQVEGGDTVAITNTRLGWASKVFDVEESEFVIDESGEGNAPRLANSLVFRETASAAYDWADGSDTIIDPAPNTNLPNPFTVATPTGLALASGTDQLYIRLDGTVFSRIKVSWDLMSDAFISSGGYVEIQYKKSADAAWQTGPLVPGDFIFAHILDVHDGVQYDVRIRARNAIGNTSAYATQSNYLVIGKTEPPANIVVFSQQALDTGILLTWDKVADLDIAQYELRYGTTWAGGTLIARIRSDGSSYLWQYGTAGTITVRIKAIDTSGNYSNIDATVDVMITGPSAVVNFAATTVDQNVLLDWEDPLPSTLSVKEYDVYKGDTFATAEKLGTVFGTFHTYVEVVGGTFTYWVVAIDAGGNRSSEVSAIATITASQDYYLQASVDPVLEVVDLFNAAVDGSVIYLPVNTHVTQLPLLFLNNQIEETWSIWWDANGWTTWQDAINDGFALYSQPSALEGFIVMEHDFGVTFDSSFISWTYTLVQHGTSPTSILPTLSYSSDGISYTDYPGATQVFASNFRYVRLRLDFEAVDGNALMSLTDSLLSIQLFREKEVQTFTANSGDVDGTVVNFIKDFLDVEAILLTVEGTTPAYAVLNFTDIADPVYFQVLVFDENGTRITRQVRSETTGAVNP